MKLLVIDDHDGEGAFPTFPRGSRVENIVPCEEVPHWSSCVICNMETFVPDIYIADNVLTVAYNPTELALPKDSIVELDKVVYEWLYIRTADGLSGWFPASKAVSIHE